MNQVETQVGNSQVEKPEEMGDGQEGERRRWLSELQIAEKNDRSWRMRGDKVIKRYRDERDDIDTKLSKMNILWSNTQTIMPALYANTPNPMVDRRNKKRDPVGLMAARIMEQAATVAMDDFDFDEVMECAVEDFQLPGRAVARVFYRPQFKLERMPAKPISYQQDFMPNYEDPDNPIPVQGDPIYAEGVEWDDEGPYTMEEVLDYETAEIDYVYWKDFRMGRAKKWAQVPWVGFRSYLTKEQAESRFGEGKAAKLKYTHRPDDDKSALRTAEDEGADLLMKVEIWEIWDKVKGQVVWVSDGYTDGVLDKADPHLKMKNFFPCTAPLIMTRTTGTMIPVPEYVQYQDQADEVDDLTNRIAILVKAIRVAGAYNSAASGLENLLSMDASENKLYPISNWQQFMDQGGLDKAVAWLPIEQMVKTVQVLYESRESAIQKIYEVTGIADIVRGASDAQETAAAQKIKGRFASMRLRDKQKMVANFARECIQLLCEVMAENFSKETLQDMTGITYEGEMQQQAAEGAQPGMQPGMQQMPQQMPSNVVAMPGMQPQQMPQQQPDPRMQQAMQDAQNEAMWDRVMDLLRNDPLRRFRIAIETDSTIQPDEMEEKQKRIEFLEATGTFMQGALGLIQQSGELTPLITEMLMFGVRGFRAGREVEEKFQEVMDNINEQASKPQQQPPDPEVVKAQIEQEKAKAKIQSDAQAGQQKLALEKMKHDQEMKQEAQKFQVEMTQLDAKLNKELQLMERKYNLEAALKNNQQHLDQQNKAADRQATASAPAPASPDVTVNMPEIELPEITVNVDANGPKKITLSRDASGNIIGGESS